MPAKYFKCPDNETVTIEDCLKPFGCRMMDRCATLPYLRLVASDRKWAGVTPSMAGTGPRLLYLKAICDYTVSPNDRAWVTHGTNTHQSLSIYDSNEFAEEHLKDKATSGTPDLLEIDENNPGKYVLTDYKTAGSFKVTKWLGIVKADEIITDDNGEPILKTRGKYKGEPKTKPKFARVDSQKDIKAETYQINRYRILFEKHGFPISKMQIFAIARDGGLWIAKNRGILKNIYIIPIKKMPNKDVLGYYEFLHNEVLNAFRTKKVRRCNSWESWEGRRCKDWCDVSEECKQRYND